MLRDADGGSVQFRDQKIGDSFDTFAHLEHCLQELQGAMNTQLYWRIRAIVAHLGILHCLQAVLGCLTMRDTFMSNARNYKSETHNSDA